jgi:hypothetical protein
LFASANIGGLTHWYFHSVPAAKNDTVWQTNIYTAAADLNSFGGYILGVKLALQGLFETFRIYESLRGGQAGLQVGHRF